ncbi:hypothetical protein CP532_4666 [Ophiocordyceps camponoti-leonardi (nom. inval.)]|nr:hypothetical protein CP532_4666 [Ophiocordyceps camponoti-leonardi (nom. inval.)]
MKFSAQISLFVLAATGAFANYAPSSNEASKEAPKDSLNDYVNQASPIKPFLHQIKSALKGEVEAYETGKSDLEKIVSATSKAVEEISVAVKGLIGAKGSYDKNEAEIINDFIHHAHQTERRLLKVDKEILRDVAEKKLCKEFAEKMSTNLESATNFIKEILPKLPDQEYKDDLSAEQAKLIKFIQARADLYKGDNCKAGAY